MLDSGRVIHYQWCQEALFLFHLCSFSVCPLFLPTGSHLWGFASTRNGMLDMYHLSENSIPSNSQDTKLFFFNSSYLYYLAPEPEIFLNSYLHRSEKCSCIIFCMSLYVYMTLMEFGDVLRPLRSNLVNKK